MTDLKITQMAAAIQQYITENKLSELKPKDLMPMLVGKGFFNKDHRAGLPLRKVLRDLDKRDMLYLIPQVRADRKAVNVSWFFNAIEV
jgi:hypothetical protein